MDFERTSDGGGMYAAKAYWNALSKLKAAWEELFEEEIKTSGNRAVEAFDEAIRYIKSRPERTAADQAKLRKVLDVEDGEEIKEVLLTYADMDDITPRAARDAIIKHAVALGEGRHELRTLLRAALDELFADQPTRRPRVGANRHWNRLLQYLRELEWETDWSPSGRGLRLMNAGGGGPVARDPADPELLDVRINPEFF